MGGGRRRPTTRFTDFGAGWDAVNASTQFYNDHSNFNQWFHGGLSGDEYDALKAYTGEGYNSYHTVNGALYTQDYKDMSPSTQQAVDNIVNGLSKFQLDRGIQVTRQCDFKIFGAQSGEKMTVSEIKAFIKSHADKNGDLLNKGVLSFGSNNHGAAIDGSGLVIHAKVPPSIGAGAYINPLSYASGGGENEWLFNAYSKFRFDLSSIKVINGKIHINALWTGREKHK